MDIDRYIAINEPVWNELDHLVKRAGGLGVRPTGAEIDRMVQLYQQASAHLSYVHTHFTDAALSARLSGIVGNASAVIYSTPGRALRSLGRFFTRSFPGAVWHARRFVAVSAILFFAPALAAGAWFANSDEAINRSMSPELREAYIESEFEDYYSSKAAAEFSTEVLVNNIRVSFLAFVGGILLCVPSAYLLMFNGLNVGFAGGIFHNAGRWQQFYGLILPHGVLELSAIVIAGAAGLSLGWAIIAPGDLPRARAVAAQGRRAVTIILGLIVAFIVAGLIEGFVTPSPLPTPVRVGVGVAVGLFFWVYLIGIGRVAAAEGYTGALGERQTGAG